MNSKESSEVDVKLEKKFCQFLKKMEDSQEYLKMGELKDGYSYKIYARNAYVGIWVSSGKTFIISRYKVGKKPYLFHENHWDTGAPCGTAKPIALVAFPYNRSIAK